MNWRVCLHLLGSTCGALAHSVKPSRAANIAFARNTTDTALHYADQINDSTYRIISHDSYVEYPFLYFKIYPELPLAVVVDTGVGVPNGAECTQAQQLKDFIESAILPQSSAREAKNTTTLCSLRIATSFTSAALKHLMMLAQRSAGTLRRE